MANVTKPIALDETLHTTENPSRNIADVLAEELAGIAGAITTAENVEDILSDMATTKTAPTISGTAVFDTVDGNFVKALTVEIEPVQDLHGYSEPWVGGAGKNKADATYYQATAMYQPVVSASFKVQSGKRYAFSFDTPNSGYTVYRQTPSVLGFSSFSEYAFALDGTRKTFYGDCNEDKVISNVQVLGSYSTTEEGETVYVTNFMIEEIPSDSTSSTAYEPYTNICPISGHTQADVYVVGKNMIDSSATAWKQGILVDGKNPISNNYWCYQEEYYPIKGGFIYSTQATIINAGRFNFYDKNYDFISAQQPMRGDSPRANITAPLNAKFFRMDFNLAGSATAITPNDIATYKLQLELGNTATTFEPYKGKTYTTAFGQTVYGGTLDVLTGELTIDSGYIASYNGETLPSTWISDRDVYTVGNTPTTGAQVVYELATPTTVQLTPQKVKSLVGENHISASTGDVTECKYSMLINGDDLAQILS